MSKIGQTAPNMTHNETLYGTQKQHQLQEKQWRNIQEKNHIFMIIKVKHRQHCKIPDTISPVQCDLRKLIFFFKFSTPPVLRVQDLSYWPHILQPWRRDTRMNHKNFHTSSTVMCICFFFFFEIVINPLMMSDQFSYIKCLQINLLLFVWIM